MGSGYLTQPFYHMIPRQTMPYSTSDFGFNHRQVEVIRHALKHPSQRYTFASHQMSHNIAYQTGRTDLLILAVQGVLELRKNGRQMTFIVPAALGERLMKIEKEARK